MIYLLINDTIHPIPQTLNELTLGQRIDFQGAYGNDLDERMATVEDPLDLQQLGIDKMFAAFQFFTGVSVEVLRHSGYVDQLASVYELLRPLLEEAGEQEPQQHYLWGDTVYQLHPPALTQGSPMTFGEFVDSKQMMKDMTEAGSNAWEKLHRLAAIYLRQMGEDYEEAFLYEGSERLELMRSLPLDIALAVGTFYDQLSTFIATHFPVFFPSKGSKMNSRHMQRHFDRFGWVNFLKGIAKTKVFDVPGSRRNSIECARQASLFDVLIYASEEKEYNEAYNADMEAMKQTA